jgi:SAM-dependent methyltransferase
MNCRHCAEPLPHTFLDLGFAPPSNAYLTAAQLSAPERYFPLKLNVCTNCWLVQAASYSDADELFGADYAYFSSTSSTWLEHAAIYTRSMIERLKLDRRSFVIEVASNDGYLLKNFVHAGVPCLGIEPTAGTAHAAEKLGIPVLREFFTEVLAKKLAAESRQADLIIANNVLAHVPDINDFVRGLQAALKPGGTITVEFPHLMRFIEHTQFDTAYHEHYSYLSLYTVNRIFRSFGLRVVDVDELSTHGGSLRVYACHANDARRCGEKVDAIMCAEERAGLRQFDVYRGFQKRADAVKDGLVRFLIEQKQSGRSVAAYGAAAKGNTLLNYGGIKPDLLPFVCDAAPSKQGKFLPGSHIPILPPSVMHERKPELILILPWNLAHEVTRQHENIKDWGGRFVIAVPEIRVL